MVSVRMVLFPLRQRTLNWNVKVSLVGGMFTLPEKS